MDIKRAKQEIEHAVKAYLAVDDTGTPLIPPIRQRPILLMGPPGVGKTQIMEQIAQECGIALGTNKMNYNSGRSSASFSCQSSSGVLGTGSGKNSSGLKTSRMAQGGVSGGGVPVSKNRKAIS